MRLTCPNCGAEYEVPEGMIPPEGKHVQCTSCHTRWFMRGSARPALSEEQVIQRLETWAPKPRLATVPTPAPATVIQMPDPKPAAPDPEEFVWETPVRPAPPPPAPAPAPAPALTADRLPPVSRPRLELITDQPVQPPRPPARRRFGRGVMVVIIPVALAIGIYVWKDAISAQVPAAAPILTDYASSVDAGREWLDDQIAALRGTKAP